MFGLFKKEKEKIINYACLGVNYQDEIEVNGENLDAVKEELFAYIKKQNKTFTRANIDTITTRLGYNIWKSFVWIDNDKLKEKFTIQIMLRYRFTGLIENASEGLTVDLNTEINKLVNKIDYYDRAEIENFSQIIGCSTWDRCTWQPFTVTTYVFSDSEIKVYSK